MSNKYKRTADEGIYASENRYNNPKEGFKQVANILNLSKQLASKSLLDIGCATGEFLYYVRTINPAIILNGVEYSENLVSISSPFLESNKIYVEQGDANALLSIQSNSYDYVTTLGVTSIFDDFRTSFDEMIRAAKDGGVCVNLMLVNEMDIDVIIKYINPKTKELESGWNKFSIKSIREYLQSKKEVKSFKFIKHTMPFDIVKGEDLMRSWTKELDGTRVLWNGLNMEISLYHIVFEISKL